MATPMQRPNVGIVRAKRRVRAKSVSSRKTQKPPVLLAAAALLLGLSIAVPAAIMVFIYPLNHAEYYYADGYWHGQVWSSYVNTGMALSIGFVLVGVVLAIWSERAAYRAAEASNVKSARSKGTPALVALALALLDLVFGPIAFMIGNLTGIVWTLAFGLSGLLLAIRSQATGDGVAEGQNAGTSRSWTTKTKVILSLALVILIFGSFVLGGTAVLTGTAVSIGFGVAGIVLSIRSERTAYRAAEASIVKNARSKGTAARAAVWFALVVLLVGPVVFVITGMAALPTGGFSVGPWIGLSLLGAGLVGIAVAVRPLTTAASLVLPFAAAALILGTWASFLTIDAGRILIGVGLVGIVVAVWGVWGSETAVTRRWLVPFAIVAFVLALLGNAHMLLIFGLQGLSL